MVGGRDYRDYLPDPSLEFSARSDLDSSFLISACPDERGVVTNEKTQKSHQPPKKGAKILRTSHFGKPVISIILGLSENVGLIFPMK